MAKGLSEDLRDPNLFQDNAPGDYTYNTEENGVRYAEGSLTLAPETPRNSQAQTTAGGEARRMAGDSMGVDDGGHLIGTRFGGSGEEENLTAQDRNLNRGDYKRIENEWARHLENGDKVYVHVETDEPQRPNVYMGYAIYEHPDGSRDWDSFYIENESRQEKQRWDEAQEQWERENPQEAQAFYEECSGLHLEEYATSQEDYLGSAAREPGSQGEDRQQTREQSR